MAGGMSDYFENKILDHLLRNVALTPPSSVYIALFTASTGLETNAPTAEVSTVGTGYARKQVGGGSGIAFNAAAGGASVLGNDLSFAEALAAWGTITHGAIMDASSGGNVLFWFSLDTSRQIDPGDIFTVKAGNLTVSAD